MEALKGEIVFSACYPRIISKHEIPAYSTSNIPAYYFQKPNNISKHMKLISGTGYMRGMNITWNEMSILHDNLIKNLKATAATANSTCFETMKC